MIYFPGMNIYDHASVYLDMLKFCVLWNVASMYFKLKRCNSFLHKQTLRKIPFYVKLNLIYSVYFCKLFSFVTKHWNFFGRFNNFRNLLISIIFAKMYCTNIDMTSVLILTIRWHKLCLPWRKTLFFITDYIVLTNLILHPL